MSKYDEHIQAIKSNYPTSGYSALREALDCAVELMSDGAEAIGKTCKWQFSATGWRFIHNVKDNWYVGYTNELEYAEVEQFDYEYLGYCDRNELERVIM